MCLIYALSVHFIFGNVHHLPVIGVERVRKCGVDTATSYALVGVPGAIATFAVTCSVFIVYTSVPRYCMNVQDVAARLPDDGLDPAWSRRVIKIQVVTIVCALVALMLSR